MFLFSGGRWPQLWTAATIALAGLVLVNNSIYFEHGPIPRFLVEKGDVARLPVWRAAFYFHVVGASICLATGIPLLFVRLLAYPRLHKTFGYIYLNSVLWVAAPTGLLMSPFAKGGLPGAAGFLVLGVLWWWVTWSGYACIRRNDLPGHVRGMVRSYCLALSAIFFRIFQIGLFGLGFADHTNYIVSLWLSLGASLWLSEACLQRHVRLRLSLPHAAINNGALP